MPSWKATCSATVIPETDEPWISINVWFPLYVGACVCFLNVAWNFCVVVRAPSWLPANMFLKPVLSNTVNYFSIPVTHILLFRSFKSWQSQESIIYLTQHCLFHPHFHSSFYGLMFPCSINFSVKMSISIENIQLLIYWKISAHYNKTSHSLSKNY